MRRQGLHKPTIEDVIELSGIEILHPGGSAMTQRTAELAGLQPGMNILDVSSGRGTQAIYYAQTFNVNVVGIDIAEDMVTTAQARAAEAGVSDKVTFRLGDSQDLPFEDNTFDASINECAVGIPDDSQKVLDEMARVTKPGGVVVIHESTWRKPLSEEEKTDLAERYGTTPLEYDEWMTMLTQAGVQNIITEFDEWSKPELFWDIRQNRHVSHYSKVLTPYEKFTTFFHIFRKHGLSGVIKTFQNEKHFYAAVLDGKLGYCLFKGTVA